MVQRALVVSLVLCVLATAGFAEAPSLPRPRKDKAANAKARLELASEVYKGLLARHTRGDARGVGGGLDLFETVQRWSLRWMEAQREVSDRKEDHVAAAEGHLDRMRKLEAFARETLRAGTLAPHEVWATEYFRLEAEKALQRLKK